MAWCGCWSPGPRRSVRNGGLKDQKSVKFMVAWEIKGQMVTTNTFPSLFPSLSLSLSLFHAFSIPLVLPATCLLALPCLFVCVRLPFAFPCLAPCCRPGDLPHPNPTIQPAPCTSHSLSLLFFFSCHHNCLSSLPSPSLSPSFFLLLLLFSFTSLSLTPKSHQPLSSSCSPPFSFIPYNSLSHPLHFTFIRKTPTQTTQHTLIHSTPLYQPSQ
ncbi:hypothetical protein K457DRAFT_768478 [Linnemannia elongata AG-77]|uniref:Uncharacterized protein n=1 Tax=Linnemannia elongata AG-77 TaxID=1314771 RepID=A0A197K9U6_9FUNG|nr:hypothetical protein K457DRAFT_768478 [Linnemannia elongata AG-77]